MSLSFTAGNFVFETLAEAIEARVVALQAGLGLTAEQAQRIRADVRSVLGNLARIGAERDVAVQEALAEVVLSLGWQAEGSRLDAVVALLGVEREPVRTSRVTGMAADGDADETIPAGTRLRYDPTGSTWQVEADAVIGPGGEVELALISEDPGAADEVATSGLLADDWTILDFVDGWADGTFASAAQPVVGRPIETDPQLRARAAQEAYRRGQGPYAAIEAQVAAVDGVTFVRCYDNPEDETDANGVPARHVYVVVEGGDDAEVAAAIWRARGGGVRTHGIDIEETITTGPNRSVVIRADRVVTVPIYVRATLTTSTSEIEASGTLDNESEAAMRAVGEATAAIGADVLPRRFAGAHDDLEGFDAVTIELSLDGVTWQTTKLAMGATQRPVFAADRISTVLA